MHELTSPQIDASRLLYESHAERGDYQSAQQLLTQIVARKERLLGRAHPELAEDLYELGLLASALDRLPIAREFLKRALGIQSKFLGLGHQDVLETLRALQEISEEQGRSPRRA